MWGLAVAILVMGRGRDDAVAANPPTVTVRGQVRPLADVLEGLGVEVDRERVSDQVLLVDEQGRGTPLLPNTASRALFTDARLRDRPAELVGRRPVGLPYFEVIVFRVQDEAGAFRIAEYYCDVCSIATRFDQICPCCQGELRLRYQPAE